MIQALRERFQRLLSQQEDQPDAWAILVKRLDRISLLCAGLPLRNQRTAEHILGHDASGLPS